jgi:hypothetical protein
MKKVKVRRHRNAVATAPKHKAKVSWQRFDAATTAACNRIIADPDVPGLIRDLTAVLMGHSTRRRSQGSGRRRHQVRPNIRAAMRYDDLSLL